MSKALLCFVACFAVTDATDTAACTAFKSAWMPIDAKCQKTANCNDEKSGFCKKAGALTRQWDKATCGTNDCKAEIAKWTDAMFTTHEQGAKDCLTTLGNPSLTPLGINYYKFSLSQRAVYCGATVPFTINVKTCDGAATTMTLMDPSCPKACPEKDGKCMKWDSTTNDFVKDDASTVQPRSKASCGNDVCKTFLNGINKADMKSGLQACASSTGMFKGYSVYANYLDSMIPSTATQCGITYAPPTSPAPSPTPSTSDVRGPVVGSLTMFAAIMAVFA